MNAYTNPARFVKNLLVPAGPRERTIVSGPFRGIHMDLDLRTQTQFYLGLFEREVYPWLTRFVVGVRTVVDVGAAHGEYALFGLLKTDAEEVIAFEPDAALVAQFRANLKRNCDTGERLRLYQSRLGENGAPGWVSVEILANSIRTPCLLKMDIDGGEADVLRAGSGHFLQVRGLRWIIETHSVSLEEQCVSILRSNGYCTRIIPNAWWRTFVPEQRVSEQNRWLAAVNDSDDSVGRL